MPSVFFFCGSAPWVMLSTRYPPHPRFAIHFRERGSIGPSNRRWARLLEGNPDLNTVHPGRSQNGRGNYRNGAANYAPHTTPAPSIFKGCINLRCSPSLPEPHAASDFAATYAREGFASWLYTERHNPRGAHKVEHNLTLAEAAGAQISPARFPIAIRADDEARVARELEQRNIHRLLRVESRRRLAFQMLACRNAMVSCTQKFSQSLDCAA